VSHLAVRCSIAALLTCISCAAWAQQPEPATWALHLDGTVFGTLSAHYRSRRYYSYLNDAPLPGAVNFNLSGGYRFSRLLDVQVNVTNLFDKQYIASTGTAGFVTSDPDGTYTTLQPAAPRQVFGTVRVHF